jgi:uncharacterized protein YndB with AHSA1/START domain
MRSHETKIEIEASTEAVWKALTEAEELKRWFCVEARVEPGAGGSVWVSWGPGLEGSSRIESWEPGRQLRTVLEDYRPAGAGEGVVPSRVAVDYYLEGQGGTTLLRVVHSGFGFGPGWDEEYEGTKRGWPVFLKTLKHALERHPGEPSRQITVMRQFAGTQAEAWARLVGPAGIVVENERFRVEGTSLAGNLDLLAAPVELAGVVKTLNDALMWLTLAGNYANGRIGRGGMGAAEL